MNGNTRSIPGIESFSPRRADRCNNSFFIFRNRMCCRTATSKEHNHTCGAHKNGDYSLDVLISKTHWSVFIGELMFFFVPCNLHRVQTHLLASYSFALTFLKYVLVLSGFITLSVGVPPVHYGVRIKCRLSCTSEGHIDIKIKLLIAGLRRSL